MSYNAGGYGTMTFPDEAALTRWKRATVSHAAYQDWIDELANGVEPDETVAKRLTRIARGHDPKIYSIQQVTIDGTRITLTWDTGEDGFRDGVADFAAFVRSADTFGAKGTFYFLGTAGAEGDFAYVVTLDGKRSKVSVVPASRRAKVAYGADYRAFVARVNAVLEHVNPAFKKFMSEAREGTRPAKRGDRSHAEVVAKLSKFSDAQLASAVAKYPALVPGGDGQKWPKEVYRATTVRAQFATPANEETRAAALWTLGALDREAALTIALDILGQTSVNEHVVAAALRVLSRASRDAGALEVAARYLTSSSSHHVWRGAQAVLAASKHASLNATLAALLGKLDAPAGGYVAAVVQHRNLVALAPAVARYAKRAKDPAAAWKK